MDHWPIRLSRTSSNNDDSLIVGRKWREKYVVQYDIVNQIRVNRNSPTMLTTKVWETSRGLLPLSLMQQLFTVASHTYCLKQHTTLEFIRMDWISNRIHFNIIFMEDIVCYACEYHSSYTHAYFCSVSSKFFLHVFVNRLLPVWRQPKRTHIS